MDNIVNEGFLEWVSSNGFPEEGKFSSNDIDITIVTSEDNPNIDCQ